MLETSHERIKLLKTGFTQKQIEHMYIEGNNFKIVPIPIQVDIVEIKARQNRNICETTVESVHLSGLVKPNIFNISRVESISAIIQ